MFDKLLVFNFNFTIKQNWETIFILLNIIGNNHLNNFLLLIIN